MPGALTAKGQATRSRIVEGAAAVLREQGIAATTLDDIMARTRTSKSQLFHYFPAGRDGLLLLVAQFEADQVLEDQQPYLGRLDSWEAWEQWRDVVVKRYEEQGDHCPLGSLFHQVGRSTPIVDSVARLSTVNRTAKPHAAVDIPPSTGRALDCQGALPLCDDKIGLASPKSGACRGHHPCGSQADEPSSRAKRRYRSAERRSAAAPSAPTTRPQNAP